MFYTLFMFGPQSHHIFDGTHNAVLCLINVANSSDPGSGAYIRYIVLSTYYRTLGPKTVSSAALDWHTETGIMAWYPGL